MLMPTMPTSPQVLMLGFLVAACSVLLGDAAPTTTGRGAQRIPLVSALRLPEGSITGRWANNPLDHHHHRFQEKTASGAWPITYNSSSYFIVGTVNVGSTGRW